MSKYPVEPCPVCGKMISSHPLAAGNHAKVHQLENPQIKEVPVSAVATPAPAAEAPITPQVAEAVKVKDPVLQARIARALAVQKDFSVAPDVWISESSSDEMMELRKRFLPESIPIADPRTGKVTKPPTKHEYFGDPREIDRDIDKGYVPIVHPVTGEQVKTPGGSPMYSLPQAMHDARIRKNQAESNRLFKQSADEMKDRSGRAVSADGVVEEVNETKTTTEGEFFDG